MKSLFDVACLNIVYDEIDWDSLWIGRLLVNKNNYFEGIASDEYNNHFFLFGKLGKKVLFYINVVIAKLML